MLPIPHDVRPTLTQYIARTMTTIGDRLGVARDATLLASCKALHSAEDLLILEHLDSGEENVLFSLQVVKKNKRGYNQNRALVVTTLAIYNFAVGVRKLP